MEKWKKDAIPAFRHCIFMMLTLGGIHPVFSQTADTSQNKTQYRLLFQLDLQADNFTTDKLQNIYYISPQNEVVKLSPDGKEQFRFINKSLGKPSYLDATNPFNLLLFYKDFQNVVTLDRTMNIAGQFNLFELGLFELNAIGMAGDGNLWVFDAVNFRLKKIGRDGNIILQSNDLSLELNQYLRPGFLLERNQQVFLNDPEVGILVFDVFGNYLKTLPLLKLEFFQVIGNQLLFIEGNQLHSFHLQALLQKTILLPEEVSQEEKLRVEKDRLYLLGKDGLKVYGF